MEYRVAPFIILTLGLLIQLLSLPEIGDSSKLVENGQKMVVAGAIILVLALSTYFRHHFYPVKSKIAYYSMLVVYLVFYFKYIYQFLTF